MRERMDVWGKTFNGGWSRVEGRLLLEIFENKTTGTYTATIFALSNHAERLIEHTIYGGVNAAQDWLDETAERFQR